MANNSGSVKQPAPPIDPTKETSKIEPGAKVRSDRTTGPT